MKKLLYLILFATLLLSGCKKKTPGIAPASLFQVTDGVTADGVSVGDGRKAFIKAYRDYTIQVAYREASSNYVVMSINRIPYKDPVSTMIANFFVDGKPVSFDTLCAENNIKEAELYTLMSSHEYLRSHDVIYRYLVFDWEDGVITDIASEELNYNETYETPRAE